ncbi:PREDICTED: FACT complex subunit SSRP1-like [Bison bison bison]|uniref:FACT complex subunit SSRP1 n=1 Tax=Bison bison bison TaxID=43346 RepID=A0A6P3HE77_BISBB|nr:PREDICTED: FACT complex subunit SSRP1-like [Bison bison bison]
MSFGNNAGRLAGGASLAGRRLCGQRFRWRDAGPRTREEPAQRPCPAPARAVPPPRINFKNSKTGNVDNIQAGELTEGIWRRVALGHGLKLLTKNGHVYKYDGFRESEFEKLSDFFKTHYRLELMEKDLCVKGWNWGTVKFGGQLLSFDIGAQPVFEIPLSNVSQCTTGKNEVTLEFHQNDDAEVSLMEVRFYVPPTQEDGVDPVEAFAQNVLSKADVIQATGDAICIFRELQCLTPRGRYDIRIYPTFLHLHGKTFDYKIPYTMVLRLGFIYIHRLPMHTCFDEISFVNFARGTTTTRSFDFEIETKQGTQYTFSSIEREEYGKLFDFVNAKKLNIKNRGLKEGMNPSYDEYADSDEDQHDAYLERMKEEGKIREENANDSSDDSGEETDESFNPGEEEEDVAEEFDSNASASSSSNEGDSDREEKKRKQLKKAKMAKDRKSRKKPLEVQTLLGGGGGRPLSVSLQLPPLRLLSWSPRRGFRVSLGWETFGFQDSEEEELASTPPSSEDSASGSDE